jgi:hypothetical protein
MQQQQQQLLLLLPLRCLPEAKARPPPAFLRRYRL